MIPVRFSLLSGLLMFLVSWNASSAAVSPSSSSPSFAVDKFSQDFGVVKRGEVVRMLFSVSNNGEAALVIEAASFSMPGMSMKVTQRIEPGQAAPLEIVWDTSGYSRDVQGQVILQTNDPAHSRVLLTLTGTVLSPIDVLPIPAFYLSQFQGQNEAQSLVIENNQEKAVRITGIEYESMLFSARSEVLEPGKRFQLTVTASSAAPVGQHRETIVVLTDDQNRPRLRIEVNILVKPDVYVSERSIDFGEVRIASLKRGPDKLKLLTQSFIISRRQGEMSIEGFKTDIPFLTVNFHPEQPSQRFRVDVGLDLDLLRAGDFSGLIRLNTDDEQFAALQIPVRIRVMD
jgi:hypothetical protein